MNILMTTLICSSCLILCISSENKTSTSSIKCDVAKEIYRKAGYTDEDIYNTEKIDNLPKGVCGLKKTCCMANAEQNLLTSSEEKRKGIANPLHQNLKEMFQVTRTKFRGIFQKMMNESQENLDSLFKTSYKAYYTNNAFIFKELYKSMQQYTNGSELDLKMIFNSFFGNLHEKIYVMYKSFLSFDERYKNCIKDNTYSIQPFGDHQERISYQITRSFEASRIFLQGLKEGMEVSMKLLELPVHEKCKFAFMKMTHCSICSGLNPNTKPCKNYCLNVMKGCYAYIIMIQSRWNKYIESMTSLTAKLKGPFNMEAMVVPLGVKISSAIMAFQDRLTNNTKKVEAVCGKLNTPNTDVMNEKKSRKVRSADDDDAKKALDTLKVSSEQMLTPGLSFQAKTQEIINSLKSSDKMSSMEYPTFMIGGKTHGPTEFEKLLSQAKNDLNELKDHWFMLPRKICDSGVASDNNTECWNGNNMDGYKDKVVADSVFELFNSNPVMDLKDKMWDGHILRLDLKLKSIIAQIDAVIEGKGITTCMDCESSGASGDNEASGDEGSGGETPKTTNTPDGSGMGSGDSSTTETDNNVDNGGGKTSKTTESNEIPVHHTKRPTKRPCSVNDPNCRDDDNNNDNNVESYKLNWLSNTNNGTKSNIKDSSSYTLTTNIVLLVTSVIMYYAL